MKAVIVDIKGKYAVALTKDGEFVKIRNKNSYIVGYEVDITSGFASSTGKLTRITAAAASILLAVGLGYGAYSYAMPYSYINIDINPSIEVTTNIYDRIINVKGLNQDGEKVLSSVSTKNKGIEAAIGDILQSAVKNGYLGNDSENAVMFTVSGKSEHKLDQIEDKIENTAEQQLNADSVETEILVEKVTIERHDKAKDMGVSPGKLLLIEKLKESSPDTDIENYKDAPVKEIMKKIGAGKKAGTNKVKTSGEPDDKTGKDKHEQNGQKRDNDAADERLTEKDKNNKDNKDDKNKGNSVNSNKDAGKDKDTGKKDDKDHKYKPNNKGKPDNGSKNTSNEPQVENTGKTKDKDDKKTGGNNGAVGKDKKN